MKQVAAIAPAPPKAQSPDSLLALARAFDMAQAQLDMVGELSHETGACPNLAVDQDTYIQSVCERMTTRLLGTMLTLSDAASRIPARTPQELAAKSRIWLGRYIPEDDNDVLVLAESICRDLTAIQQGSAP